MKNYPTSTLVTPTYNWPEALELLLLSVKNQSVLPNEVIVADDGSREETTKLIQKYQIDFPIPLIHIRHDDNGNQKPMIMNKAIAKAKYEYIIEIDGDIIMHKDFIKDHLTYAAEGFYLFGSRASVQESFLNTIFDKKTIHFGFFSKGIKKRTRTIRLPLFMKFAKIHNERSRKLRGCNMSFWKKDFIKVNGFNERLVGWGIDDSELIQRLHNINIRGKRLKQTAIAYHIYHKEQSKKNLEINNAIEKRTTENKIIFIENGINQYL